MGQFENSDLVKIHEHDRRSQRAVLLCVERGEPAARCSACRPRAGNLHGRKVVIGIFSLGLDGGAGVLFRFDLAANERHIADDASGLIASESTVGLGEILIVVWARLPPQKVLQRDEGGVAEREPGEGVTGLDLSYLKPSSSSATFQRELDLAAVCLERARHLDAALGALDGSGFRSPIGDLSLNFLASWPVSVTRPNACDLMLMTRSGVPV